mgnify:CR=1 FL=1
MNRDPVKRLKDAMGASTVTVYLLRAAYKMPADQYIIVSSGLAYSRFSLVSGMYPAQRDAGYDFRLPPSDPLPFGQIPVPMRHALAGWYWVLTGKERLP